MDVLDMLDFMDEEVEAAAIERVSRDRQMPFDTYDDGTFKGRYRLGTAAMHALMRIVCPQLQRPSRRNQAIPPVTNKVIFVCSLRVQFVIFI